MYIGDGPMEDAINESEAKENPLYIKRLEEIESLRDWQRRAKEILGAILKNAPLVSVGRTAEDGIAALLRECE